MPICAAFKYKESHNNDTSRWGVMIHALLDSFSLLFQARDKCLSITMVYYVCAAKWTCIHRTPRTFIFTCLGKKAENIGRQPLSTSPQTFCPLVTSHCCWRDHLACVSQPVTIMGWVADDLGLEKWVNSQISQRDHHFRWAGGRSSSKVWRHKSCWPFHEIKNPTSLRFWPHT